MTGRSPHALGPRGEIRDWLVGPVWAEPADDLNEVLEADGSPWGAPGRTGRWVLTNGPDVSGLKQALYARRPLTGELPAGEPVVGGEVAYAGRTGVWSRLHAPDGVVDHSEFCFTPMYRLGCAAAVLEVDQADRRTLAIAATGPWQAFLNGEPIASSHAVTYMEPAVTEVTVSLPSRTSVLTVVTWQVAFREVRHVLSVTVRGLPVRVVVPDPSADEHACTLAERLLGGVGLLRWGVHDNTALLTGPAGLALEVAYGRRRTEIVLGSGPTPVDLGSLPEPEEDVPVAILSADDRIVIRVADPRGRAVSRELPISVLPAAYRGEPVGEPQDWRREFLEHAATVAGVGGALAGLQLDPEREVTADDVARALWMVDNRADCADFEVIGLAHLLHKARRWAPGVRESVETAVTGLRYWIDQPGLDAMCFFTENHQLIWHTAEILMGELFGDRTFTATGWSGAQHAAHGRELARQWFDIRLPGGFAEFDSNAYLAIDTLAAVSLVELGADRELAELARSLADRLLVSLATNAWRGVHGCAHGRSYVGTLRSSRLEETAPILWLCAGVGALNAAVLPTAVIASSPSYEVPEVVRRIATEPPAEYWGGQRFEGRYRFEHDLLERPYGSESVVYRTPDVMLASVQDYRSGLPGLQEHVFGATLGPETQVFVTHPPNRSTSPSSRPNAWAGNRVMPRVRQHRGALVALYRLPADDPEGRTHAWFPAAEMDEWRRQGEWAVGRRGDGYVALWTPGGSRFTVAGGEAGQELNPVGPGRVWACCVGSAALDGSFDAYADSLTTPLVWEEPEGPAIEWRTLRDGDLRLRWEGPFEVDGSPVGVVDGRLVETPALWGPYWSGLDADGVTVTAGGASHRIDLRPSGRRG